jgi:transcriptional regulator with XRE-family HTH domain
MSRHGGWPPTGFGGRLKELRTTAELTQQQLADAAGVAQSMITKLERGLSEPAWPVVLALAEALSVNLEVFRADWTSKRPRGRPRKGE